VSFHLWVWVWVWLSFSCRSLADLSKYTYISMHINHRERERERETWIGSWRHSDCMLLCQAHTDTHTDTLIACAFVPEGKSLCPASILHVPLSRTHTSCLEEPTERSQHTRALNTHEHSKKPTHTDSHTHLLPSKGMYSMKRTLTAWSCVKATKSASSSSFIPRITTQFTSYIHTHTHTHILYTQKHTHSHTHTYYTNKHTYIHTCVYKRSGGNNRLGARATHTDTKTQTKT